MKEKLLVNLVVAYLIFPILITSDYWPKMISGEYTYYAERFISVQAYWNKISPNFLFAGTAFGLLSLLPFQLLKDHWLAKHQPTYLKSLGLYIAWNTFVIVITGYGLVFILIMNETKIPLAVFLLIWSIVIHAILYFQLDKESFTESDE
ncbi:hypothetical protein [Sphingobacterium sp. LRF_L2]|uniref:hypothetical protein n=1 Tax=Sphingobacterium sp. LRF_L2 TaxID=3369421 RepID=UPI003F5D973C